MAGVRKASIKDVAEAAQVSIATVSRVISGAGTVNPEMAGRVQEAATRLGYRPNGAARGLASGQHHCVGVVVPDVANPYFAQVLRAISAESERQSYRLLVADTRQVADGEAGAALDLLAHADGVILVAPRAPRSGLRQVAESGAAAVMVNRIELGIDLPMVAVDNFSPMLEICAHLAERGHRKVAYLDGPTGSWQNNERRRAVAQASVFGLAHEVVPAAGGTLAGGYEAVDAALATGATAIVAFNDQLAYGAMAGLAERGLRVPDDMAVTGFDDSEIGRYTHPALTTASSPMTELGRIAWQMLAARLAGKAPDNPEPLAAAVAFRASSAAPARTFE